MFLTSILSNIISTHDLREKFKTSAEICLILLGFFFPISHMAASTAALLVLLFSLLSAERNILKEIIYHNPLCLLFLAFFGWMLLSLLYTRADLGSAMNDLSKYFRLALVPVMMSLFWNSHLRDKAIKAFLLAMVVTSIIAYAKYFGLLHFRSLSPDDVFMNRIQTGFLTAFAAFLAAHAISLKTRFNSRYLLLFLLFTSNMIFTNTGRTGLVIYCGLVVLFIFQKANKKSQFILVGGMVLTLSCLVINSPRLRTMIIDQPLQDISKLQSGSTETTSIGARITMATYTFDIAKQHFLFGTGAGSHRTEFTKYNLPVFENGLKWGDPHNQYLLIFFEFGLIGLLLLFAIFYTQLRLSREYSNETKYISQGAVIAIILGCLCDSLLFLASTGTCYVYFTSLGLGASLSPELQKKQINQKGK